MPTRLQYLSKLAVLLLATGFAGELPAKAQVFAQAQQPLRTVTSAQPTQRSLREVLTEIKDQYGVEILYEDRLISDQQTSVAPNFQQSVAKTLRDILTPLGLRVRQVRPATYLILGQKKGRTGSAATNGSTTELRPGLGSNGQLEPIDIPAPEPLSQAMNRPGSELPVDVSVSGQVTDEASGGGLPGVSVVVKGTGTAPADRTRGTVTDAEGRYRLTVPTGDVTLVFSFVGYVGQEVALVAGQTTINVALAVDQRTLNEVVVTGYSSQRKSDITGSVAVVDVNALKTVPASSAVQALQGQAPGVTVISAGAPGGRNDIFIRGITSFGNTQPLIIIDGVQGDLNNLNMNDIESVQVLKDAGAASIYGVRGANGVIVVTTKKGKSGAVTITYDGYYGVQTPPGGNVFNLMNGEDYARITKQVNPVTKLFANGLPDFTYAGPGVTGTAMKGDPAVDPAKYNFDPANPANDYLIQAINKGGTDWFHEIFKPAPMQSHNLTASGGTSTASYLFSFGYLNQQGTLIETYLKRYSVRVNTQYNLRKNIRVGENLYGFYKQNPGFNNLSEGNAISHAYRIMPIIPVRDIAGNYGGTWLGPEFGEGENAVAVQENTRNNRSNFWDIGGNVFAEIDFLKHLTARSSFGGLIDNQYFYSFTPNLYHSKQDHNSANSFNENAAYNSNITWTNTLTYNQLTGRHNLKLLVGSEAIRNYGRIMSGAAKNFYSTDPDYLLLNNGTTNITNSSNAYINTLFSLFSRLDYVYNDRYLIGVTVRRDGSSVFGANKRFGLFPSYSVGWRVSGEPFMKPVSFVNELLLRASHGTLGSQANVNPANAYSLYGSGFGTSYYDINGVSNATQQGFRQSRIGNPSTGWEQNVITNIGVDASLFNNRLGVSVEWYKKSINGLLFPLPLPATVGGATAPTVNIGDIQNKGWDVSLSYRNNLSRTWSINLRANLSAYRNLVVNIPDPGYFDVAGSRIGTLVRNQAGHPVGSFFGYEVIGLFRSDEDVKASPPQTDAAPGRFKYRDVNNDGEITAADRTFFGNPNPDFTYGLNVNVKYRRFDLSGILYGSQGNDVINWVRYYTDFMGTSVGKGKSNVLLDAWRPDNLDARTPVVEYSGSFSTNGAFNSYFMEDGSFLKLRTLTLGYTLNPALLRRLGLTNCRAYVQAANLFTLSRYSGIDPELTGSLGGNQTNNVFGNGYATGTQSSATFGIDYGNYPNNQRNFLLGLSFSF
jgi:TonB-linked SusC/RagA family outer membrane protein